MGPTLVRPEPPRRSAQPPPLSVPPPSPGPPGVLRRLASRASDALGRLQTNESGANFDVYRNIPYLGSGLNAHLADVFVPRSVSGPLPVVLYVHGGAFMLGSKDTHFVFGQSFASAGYVVVNVNYRLAPQYRFPACVEDVSHALLWIRDNIHRFGGDPGRVVLAGESAGANLVTTLSLCCCTERPEPYAAAVYASEVVPRAVIASQGIFRITRPRRSPQLHTLPALARRVLQALPESGGGRRPNLSPGPPPHDLREPVLALERRAQRFERPLPPFFLPVGSADPLLEETRRMERALLRRRVPHEARYYPGVLNAFHLMTGSAEARLCWRDTFRFLDRHLAPETRHALRS